MIPALKFVQYLMCTYVYSNVLDFGVLLATYLGHSNSISRCVAIITTSIFVFLCTTYYQTLLLSIYEASCEIFGKFHFRHI